MFGRSKGHRKTGVLDKDRPAKIQLDMARAKAARAKSHRGDSWYHYGIEQASGSIRIWTGTRELFIRDWVIIGKKKGHRTWSISRQNKNPYLQ